MTQKPSQRPEVLAVIQRHGPITCAAIASRLGLTVGSINYHLGQLGTDVHIADWAPSRTSRGQFRWSAKWQAGPGENVPQPKDAPGQTRAHVAVDLAAMPYRSVFAGGVSPWAAMGSAA